MVAAAFPIRLLRFFGSSATVLLSAVSTLVARVVRRCVFFESAASVLALALSCTALLVLLVRTLRSVAIDETLFAVSSPPPAAFRFLGGILDGTGQLSAELPAASLVPPGYGPVPAPSLMYSSACQ